MTLKELKDKVGEILPNARFDLGKFGEIIIHTNLEIEESDRPDRANRELVEYLTQTLTS